MLKQTIYVPALRWKQAEREALNWLSRNHKAQLTPLIEITPRNFQTPEGKKRSVREALQGIARDIQINWGSNPAFVDLAHSVNAGICTTENGSHALEALAEETRQVHPLFPSNSTLIPVTGLGRAKDYQDAVCSIVEQDKTGACFRVTLTDIADKSFVTNVESLFSRLKVDVSDVDLVVDLQSWTPDCPNFQDLCAALPQLSKWRRFVVLAGSFPKDLQGLKEVGQHTLPRDEWFYWREQVQTLPRPLRPAFGDYTIQHAVFEEPPDKPHPSASIRYTYSDYWVIMRGEALSKEGGPGYSQYPAEATILCEMDEFCGANFSPGDRYIYEATQTPEQTGNPCTWLRAGINHHMIFVLHQVVASASDFTRASQRKAN